MAGLQGEHIVRYPVHSRDSKRKSKDAPAAAASSECRCPSPESSPEASSCQPRPKADQYRHQLINFAFRNNNDSAQQPQTHPKYTLLISRPPNFELPLPTSEPRLKPPAPALKSVSSVSSYKLNKQRHKTWAERCMLASCYPHFQFIVKEARKRGGRTISPCLNARPSMYANLELR